MKARLAAGFVLLICFCSIAVNAQTSAPKTVAPADLEERLQQLRSDIVHDLREESRATTLRLWIAAVAAPILTALGFVFVYQQIKLSRTQAQISAQQAQIAARNLCLATDAANRATAQATEQQNWKKAEFLAGQVKDFLSDEVIACVSQMVDFSQRRMKIEKYGPKEIFFVHDEQTLEEENQKRETAGKPPFESDRLVVLTLALEHHDKVDEFTRLEALVRDDFDWFFFRLGEFHHMIESGLFTYPELEIHLRYVLDLISGGREHVADTLVGQIKAYVAAYDFSGAEALIAERVQARTARAVTPTPAVTA